MTLRVFEKGPSRSSRVIWLLNELQLSFEAIDVDLRNPKSPQNEEFIEVNPLGKVPAINHNGFYLFESVAIMNYLSALKPEFKMIPLENPQERALYDQWMMFATTELEENLWNAQIHSWLLPEELRSETAIKASHFRYDQSIQILEKHLATHDYVCGAELKAVDLSLAYLLNWASQTHWLNAENHPYCSRYLKKLLAREHCPYGKPQS